MEELSMASQKFVEKRKVDEPLDSRVRDYLQNSLSPSEASDFDSLAFDINSLDSTIETMINEVKFDLPRDEELASSITEEGPNRDSVLSHLDFVSSSDGSVDDLIYGSSDSAFGSILHDNRVHIDSEKIPKGNINIKIQQDGQRKGKIQLFTETKVCKRPLMVESSSSLGDEEETPCLTASDIEPLLVALEQELVSSLEKEREQQVSPVVSGNINIQIESPNVQFSDENILVSVDDHEISTIPVEEVHGKTKINDYKQNESSIKFQQQCLEPEVVKIEAKDNSSVEPEIVKTIIENKLAQPIKKNDIAQSEEVFRISESIFPVEAITSQETLHSKSDKEKNQSTKTPVVKNDLGIEPEITKTRVGDEKQLSEPFQLGSSSEEEQEIEYEEEEEKSEEITEPGREEEGRTEREFQRMVSQLSVDEVREALEIWKEEMDVPDSDPPSTSHPESDRGNEGIHSSGIPMILERNYSSTSESNDDTVLVSPLIGQNFQGQDLSETIRLLHAKEPTSPNITNPPSSDEEASQSTEDGREEKGQVPAPKPTPRTSVSSSFEQPTESTDTSDNYAAKKMFWEQISSDGESRQVPTPRPRSSISSIGSKTLESFDRDSKDFDLEPQLEKPQTQLESYEQSTIEKTESDNESEKEYIEAHKGSLEYDNKAFSDEEGDTINKMPVVKTKRHFERSVSLPCEPTEVAVSVRAKKQIFEAQIKKEMVVEQLMTQQEKDSSPEHKSIEDKRSLPTADPEKMMSRQIHSHIFTHELEEQIEDLVPEDKKILDLSLHGTGSSEVSLTKEDEGFIKPTVESIENLTSEEPNAGSKGAEVLQYKKEIAKPSDSLEVHVDKSELELSEKEKEGDEDLKESDGVLLEDKKREVSSRSSSQGESEDTRSESDITPEDARFREQQYMQEWEKDSKKLDCSDGKPQLVCTPEEHIPDTVWEVPVQQATDIPIEESTEIFKDIEVLITKPDAEERLSKSKAKEIAETVIKGIEEEIRRRSENFITPITVPMEEEPYDVQEKLLIQIKPLPPASMTNKSALSLTRTDTATSSIDITDEDLRSSGVEADMSPIESHKLEAVLDLSQEGSESADEIETHEIYKIEDHDPSSYLSKRSEKTVSPIKEAAKREVGAQKTESKSLEGVKVESEGDLSTFRETHTEITAEAPKTEVDTGKDESKLFEGMKVESDLDLAEFNTTFKDAFTKEIVNKTEQKSFEEIKIEEAISSDGQKIEKEMYYQEAEEIEERKTEFTDLTSSSQNGDRNQRIMTVQESSSSLTCKEHSFEQEIGIDDGVSHYEKADISKESKIKETDLENRSERFEKKSSDGTLITTIVQTTNFTSNTSELTEQSNFEIIRTTLQETAVATESNNGTKEVHDPTDVHVIGAKIVDEILKSSPSSSLKDSTSSSDKKSKETSSSSTDLKESKLKPGFPGPPKSGDKSGTDQDPYSSSGESHYQSFEQTSESVPPSRPLSSDVEGLVGNLSGNTSEYVSAVSATLSGHTVSGTSPEYKTAASSMSSRDSMKSLDSESSGNLASVEVSSEASETLVASAMELERDDDLPEPSKVTNTNVTDISKRPLQPLPIASETEDLKLHPNGHPVSTDQSDDEISDEELEEYSDSESTPGKKMKRSLEMTFQPEPRPIVDDSFSDIPSQLEQMASLEEMGSLNTVSSASESGTTKTVIQQISPSPSPMCPVSRSGTGVSLDMTESIEGESQEHIGEVKRSVVSTQYSLPESADRRTSVTLCSTSVEEKGISSVYTQVTSQLGKHSNGPTQVEYSSDYDENKEARKKPGHRRNGSTSVKSVVALTEQDSDFKSFKKDDEEEKGACAIEKDYSVSSKESENLYRSIFEKEKQESELYNILRKDSSSTEEPFPRPRTPEPPREIHSKIDESEIVAKTEVHKTTILEKFATTQPEEHRRHSMSLSSPLHHPQTIIEDPDAEIQESQVFEEKKKFRPVERHSPSNVPDITVTEPMTPHLTGSFDFPVGDETVEIMKEEGEDPFSKPIVGGRIIDDLDDLMFDNQDDIQAALVASCKAEIELDKKSDSESITDSATSDSFELVDKPDILEEFVVIEEIGREAHEQDSEGKSMKIASTGFIRKKRVENEEISPPRKTTAKMIEVKYYGGDDSASAAEELGEPCEKSSSLEESPPKPEDFSDEVEANKKWMEMQFKGEPAAAVYGYGTDYDRGPLEDIKEEDANELESSSRIGSMGSQVSHSIGSFGSVKESLSSTPDYDVLAGKKYFTRSGDHDDVSMSSLQEFERLEHLVALESTKTKTSGSQDSLTSSSNSKKHGSRSGDDQSLASLKEFEGLESACIAAEHLEKKAKADEELLLSEIEEGHESLASESESCITISAMDMKRGDSEDDYEKRMFEIDEIIRQAQVNVETFLEGSNNKLEIEKTLYASGDYLGPSDSLEEVARVADLELDQPFHKPDELDEMLTSTDSLEMRTQVSKGPDIFSTSTDSLERTVAGLLTTSIDSLDAQKPVHPPDIMADSIELSERLLITSTDSLEVEGKKIIEMDSIEDLHAAAHQDRSSASSVRDSSYSWREESEASGLRIPPQRAEFLLGSTDSLEPTSSTATHATYQFETDSVMSSSFTSGDSNTMVSSTENLDQAARASMWFDDGKPYVTEIIEPGDDEFSHVIHRTVEMPPEIHKITFKGNEADAALKDYIDRFDPGEDIAESQQVDEFGNVHIKRVVQRRVVIKPEDLGDKAELSAAEVDSYIKRLTQEGDLPHQFVNLEQVYKKSGVPLPSVESQVVSTTRHRDEIGKKGARNAGRPPLKYDISMDEEPDFDPREHDWRFNLLTHLESEEEAAQRPDNKTETSKTAEAGASEKKK